MKEHEDLLEGIRSDLSAENRELSKKLEHTNSLLDSLKAQHEGLSKKYQNVQEDFENEERSSETKKVLFRD